MLIGHIRRRQTSKENKSSFESWEKLVENSLGNHSICLATADISPTLKFFFRFITFEMGVISNTKEQFRKTKAKAPNFSFVSENWTTKKVYGLVRLFLKKLISKTVFYIFMVCTFCKLVYGLLNFENGFQKVILLPAARNYWPRRFLPA